EHSAMAVCIGAAAAGARTFTTTSGNGLAYMAENAIAAALLRLPVVMVAANRTLGPPWNLWPDHGDTLMLRDFGWVQFYCADNQEVFDTVLCAYRLAEDRRILLPVLICQESFVLSHTMAETGVATQEQVDRFLPPLELANRLGETPRVVGGVVLPHLLEVHRAQHHEALGRVWSVYEEAQEEFERCFGRRPADPVVGYRAEDAEVLLVSMGTMAVTVERSVDGWRARGLRVGAVRVRAFRPFPAEQLTGFFGGVSRIGVLDRNLSLGFGGVLWGEARGLAPNALVQGYVIGIGGGDVRPEHVDAVVEDLGRRQAAAPPMLMEVGL
ncbi:MAG: pyruvate ferredoxin oxidoreductase, partial [Deltaproteobacteria bacterium]|nr:pyruvate ferredoxin oxidoreductase [Deltaproteobacteria bacterium]